MSHNGIEGTASYMLWCRNSGTCCAMRYDWSCSSCSSNFGYRDGL